MFKKLEELIRKTEGNVLAICLDDKLMDVFNKKDGINLYSLTSNKSIDFITGLMSKRKKDKPKYKKNNKGKDINIKKLRKELNKKSVDYLFCNMDEMIDYYKYFIKDSIYLSNNKIYIYFDKKLTKIL